MRILRPRDVVLLDREILGPAQHQVADVQAVRGHHGAEELQQPEVPGEHVQRRTDVDHHERHDERRRDHPRGAAHAELDRQRAAAATAIALHVREILRRGRAEQKQAEDRADVPRLDAGDRFHRRPARDLQQHAARNRDRHVRPDAEPLGPERRYRIEERAHDRDRDQPEALMPSAGCDEPCEHQCEHVSDDAECPRLRDRQAAAGERALRLVHAIDLEVVDLVERVVAGIEHRGHQRSDERRNQQLRRPRLAWLRANRRERARYESKGGRDERERPRQVDVRANAHAIASATAAATAVLMKFNMSLFRIPGPSSVAPSALSTSAPTVAPPTTATIIVVVI